MKNKILKVITYILEYPLLLVAISFQHTIILRPNFDKHGGNGNHGIDYFAFIILLVSFYLFIMWLFIIFFYFSKKLRLIHLMVQTCILYICFTHVIYVQKNIAFYAFILLINICFVYIFYKSSDNYLTKKYNQSASSTPVVVSIFTNE